MVSCPDERHRRRDVRERGVPPGTRHDHGLEVRELPRRGDNPDRRRGGRGCRNLWRRCAALQLGQVLSDACSFVVECAQAGPKCLNLGGGEGVAVTM